MKEADGAVLMERAEAGTSLAQLSVTGSDEEACRIICAIAAKLHEPRSKPLPKLTTLTEWFRPLHGAASSQNRLLARSAAAAGSLLGSQQDMVPLHGDLHHDNVLKFGTRGWLAIDPKGLMGERSFEYVALFCNPDKASPGMFHARKPQVFARRVEVVSDAADIVPRRLLSWILAWTGLSAAWHLADGQSPDLDLTVAAMAVAALDS